MKLDVALLVFGAGLAMALDEWVYLIATDGTNASYLLPVSLWGGIVVTGLACVYARRACRRPSPPAALTGAIRL